MIRSRFAKPSISRFDSEGVNPMEGVANLADAMLVLAVGIMLAVIIAWNVDIGTDTTIKDSMVEIEADSISDNAAVNEGSIEDSGLKEAGKVYVDEDGNLYMLAD